MNNELTAALLTIEKCRELSGCPAGVDLQDWVKQLAAENVGLKEDRDTLARYWIEDGGDKDCAMSYCEPTPATDRIVAAQRSAFVDEAVAKITESGALTFGDYIVSLCQLREGADK
ncbi:TPA: hypothetical protein N3288_002331 [Klebsiella aerogenes]|nr:hypothetical protein [Klebsiella aerogenes]